MIFDKSLRENWLFYDSCIVIGISLESLREKICKDYWLHFFSKFDDSIIIIDIKFEGHFIFYFHKNINNKGEGEEYYICL